MLNYQFSRIDVSVLVCFYISNLHLSHVFVFTLDLFEMYISCFAVFAAASAAIAIATAEKIHIFGCPLDDRAQVYELCLFRQSNVT